MVIEVKVKENGKARMRRSRMRMMIKWTSPITNATTNITTNIAIKITTNATASEYHGQGHRKELRPGNSKLYGRVL